ncbi:MAG: caspase family protein [Deltaproteobacteria bacterium]|nr:caspase family protein [Deltaproteobacteria bacterium]
MLGNPLGVVVVASLACHASLASGAEDRHAARFAVVVGANIGDGTEPRLRYAERDAQNVAQTLRDVGDFPPDQVLLLNGVRAADVRDTLHRLNARIRERADEAVLFVYYSGHADGNHLKMAGTQLHVEEMRLLVEGSSAATRVLVIDSCRSGTATRVKGGRPTPAFEVALQAQPLPKGFAILTSSAAHEDSQEAESLKASFFSHFFVSAMRGAGDANGDGVVTVSEAFDFSSRETMSATLRTEAGPQHPTFRMNWGGREDLALTRPRRLDGTIGALQFIDAGGYTVTRLDGDAGLNLPVAEIASHAGGAMVALESGRYEVTKRGSNHMLAGDYKVRAGLTEIVASDEMKHLTYARMVRKGDAPRTVHSASLGGGYRTDPMIGISAWVTTLSYRQDRRRFALEARIAGSKTSGHKESYIREQEQWDLSALLLYPKDFEYVTLSAGIEAGVFRLEQRSIALIEYTNAQIHPSFVYFRSPSEGLKSSLGGELSPILQLDVPFRFRAYLRFEGARPFHLLKAYDTASISPALKVQTSWRGTVSVGIFF